MPATLSSLSTQTTSHMLQISRLFDAPRELVFEAFTNPAMLAQWMGPRGFTAMDVQNDVRPGGKWSLRLHKTVDQTACESHGLPDMWQRGTYLEVAPPERLVYTFGWDQRSGVIDYETTISITLREMEGKTVMDFTQGPFQTGEHRDGHNVGWSSSFDRLTEFLARS